MAAAGQAIGIQLTIGEAALISSGVALATAIPSGPGYLGTFELAAITIGTALGLTRDQATALAFLVHASILILTSTGGAIAFLRLGWHGSADEIAEVARGMVDSDRRLGPGGAGEATPAAGGAAPEGLGVVALDGRQTEPEPGPLVHRCDAYPTAGGLDQLADDGQADPGSAVGAVARLLDPVEPLEDVAQVGGRDAFTGIGDRHRDLTCCPVHGDRRQPAGRRVADRVLQEVAQHLGEVVGPGMCTIVPTERSAVNRIPARSNPGAASSTALEIASPRSALAGPGRARPASPAARVCRASPPSRRADLASSWSDSKVARSAWMTPSRSASR